jgi:hypothetical protein
VSPSIPARRLVAAGAAAVAALAVTIAPEATATSAAPSAKTVVAKKLLSPLSVDVTAKDAVVYSANFAGTLYLKNPGKKAEVIFQSAQQREVGAIAVDRTGVWFVHGATLMRRSWKGDRTVVANLSKFEQAENPDGDVTYGAADVPEECIAQFPTGEEAPPPVYDGIVESHPYGTAAVGRQAYVADAAGNSILRVRRNGTVEAVAVLPPIPVEITEELAEGVGFPECSVGHDYLFEPVPTDVEMGADGLLYVSSLPGGPEDGTVPGGVFTVDPETGEVAQVATGLISATGLDVAPNGDVYVSELFAGKITRIPAGGGEPSTYLEAPLPAAVEIKGRHLYTTQNVLSGLSGEPGDAPAGTVVRYKR